MEKRHLKVLQINSVSDKGSTGQIVKNIHKLLLSKKFESIIAYGRESLIDHEEKNYKIGNTFDMYNHVFLTRVLDLHGFASRKATKKFIEFIQNEMPDIIHLHNIHGYYLNIEELFQFIKKEEIPVVWTLHDCWPFTGHCAYFDYSNCKKWIEGCNSCPEKNSYPKSIGIDNSRQNYLKKQKLFNGVHDMTIVTPSKWLSSTLRKSYLKEYTSVVINNGINLDVFRPVLGKFKEKRNIKSKKIILGVASVWDRRKGLNYFIDLSKVLNENEVIVLIGLDSKQIKNLPYNIIGIERTNNVEELVEIYSSSDVFFNPTLEDNFPTTNLEALACGLPVATFDTGGSIEPVNNLNGVIIKDRQAEKIIGSLRKAMDLNKEDCIKSSRQYKSEDKFNEYIDLYKEIMKRKYKNNGEKNDLPK